MKRYRIVKYDRETGDISFGFPVTLGECLAELRKRGFRRVKDRIYMNDRYFCKIWEVEDL